MCSIQLRERGLMDACSVLIFDKEKDDPSTTFNSTPSDDEP